MLVLRFDLKLSRSIFMKIYLVVPAEPAAGRYVAQSEAAAVAASDLGCFDPGSAPSVDLPVSAFAVAAAAVVEVFVVADPVAAAAAALADFAGPQSAAS